MLRSLSKPSAAALVAVVLFLSAAGSVRAERPAPSSRSIGLPWQGRLTNGVLLQAGEHVGYLDRRPAAEHFYGTAELVRLLEHGAARVAEQHPGARLVSGDLGKRGGGEIAGHHSHENGRDADLAFYMTDAAGRPWTARRFLRVRPDGSVEGARAGVRFDVERNWALVEALLEAEDVASIQYLFVSNEVRHLLLLEAQRRGTAPEVLARAGMVLVQPRNGEPHDDHFHVRIYCPRSSGAQCRDVSPQWPSLSNLRRRLHRGRV